MVSKKLVDKMRIKTQSIMTYENESIDGELLEKHFVYALIWALDGAMLVDETKNHKLEECLAVFSRAMVASISAKAHSGSTTPSSRSTRKACRG